MSRCHFENSRGGACWCIVVVIGLQRHGCRGVISKIPEAEPVGASWWSSAYSGMDVAVSFRKFPRRSLLVHRGGHRLTAARMSRCHFENSRGEACWCIVVVIGLQRHGCRGVISKIAEAEPVGASWWSSAYSGTDVAV